MRIHTLAIHDLPLSTMIFRYVLQTLRLSLWGPSTRLACLVEITQRFSVFPDKEKYISLTGEKGM